MTGVIRSLVNAYSRYIHVKQEQHDWRPLKVNAGKSKVMVLNGEEELECEVYVDRIRLEHASEFKYFG